MPTSTVVPMSTSSKDMSTSAGQSDGNLEDDNLMDTQELIPEAPTTAVQDDWQEATFILNLKEQYVLPQVAIDHVVSCTKVLVSDILGRIINDVCGNLPADSTKLLENRVMKTNTTLFGHLSTASLQKKYFKQHFNLIVSD